MSTPKPRRRKADEPVILKLFEPPYPHAPDPHFPPEVDVEQFVRHLLQLITDLGGKLDQRDFMQRAFLTGNYLWVRNMIRNGTAPRMEDITR